MTEPRHWFEPLADHMRSAYLRYSFTKGTVREIDALIERTGLRPGDRVLDVGCGPGRHANELGRRGVTVHGVDISQSFLDLAAADAPAGVTYERLDARHLPFDSEFDCVVSICQGAFGLAGGPAATATAEPEADPDADPDAAILAGMARAVRPGGHVVFTAFNAYLQVRHILEGDDFDAGRGVHRETTEVRDEDGRPLSVDVWTTCFTPREVRLLVASVGLDLVSLHAVEPGDWRPRAPDIESPELLAVATRSGRG